MLPKMNVDKDKEWIVYANEADILNVALFGSTSKQWKQGNPTIALSGGNIRDCANINQLILLSNLESINSIMIKQGTDRKTRFGYLQQLAKEQMVSLKGLDLMKSVQRIPSETYLDAENVYTATRKQLPSSK